MLDVRCESCQAPYQVDERRVPATGLRMRCPKCGHSFVVQRPAAAAAMIAAAKLGARPSSANVAPPRPAGSIAPQPSAMATPAMGTGDDMPARATPSGEPKRPDLVRKRPKLRSIPDDAPSLPIRTNAGGPEGMRPTMPELPAVVIERANAARPLPAAPITQKHLAEDAAVTARRGFGNEAPTAPHSVPRPGLMTAPRMEAVKLTGAPMSASGALRTDDMPARAGLGKGKSGFGELDWADDLPAAPAPSRAKIPSSPQLGDFMGDDLLPDLAFGELPQLSRAVDDLPGRADDLPGRAGDLPSRPGDLPSRPGNLPSRAGDLPQRAIDLPQRAHDLPERAPSLPERVSDLPLSLDSLPAMSDPLPAMSDPLPLLVDALPSRSEPPFAGGGDLWPPNDAEQSGHGFEDPLGFGELELPPLPADSMPPPVSAPPPFSLGMRDLPLGSEPPPMSLGRPGEFGELDLGPLLDAPAGGGGPTPAAVVHDHGDALPPPPPLEMPGTPGAFAPQGFIGTVPGAAPVEDPKLTRARRRSRVAVVAVALLALGGGALELTELGAYARHPIADAVNKSAYAQQTQGRLDAFEAALKSDVYAGYTNQNTQLRAAADAAPRAWDLQLLAAYAENLSNLRFGADAARSARADALFARGSKRGSAALRALADVARQATPSTAAALRAQLKNGFSGPLALEAALLDAELALLANDRAGATEAYQRAQQLGGGTRADWGVQRAKAPSYDRAALDAILAAVPAHAGARIALARTQIADGDRTAAFASLALVPADSSPHGNAEALALKGNLLLDGGKTAEARTAFDEAFKLDPNSESALLGQAESLLQSGRYTEALARFEGAMKLPKSSAKAVVGVARTKLKLEAAPEAEALLVTARTARPEDAEVAYWLGETKRRLGKLDEALALFDAAEKLYLTSSPDAFLPYAAEAKIQSQRGEEAKAHATLDEAKKALPASVALERAFGDLAASGGHYDAALGYYREASAREPKDWAVHLELAELFRKTGKFDDAAKELALITAADKDFPGVTLERGILLEQTGKLDEALTEFKNALAAAPDDLDRMLRVGGAYLAVGQVEEAVPLLEKVQRARPDSAEAQHYLGRAKLLRGGPFAGDALRLLKRAAELDPNNAQFHVYVAWAANESTPPQVGFAREEAERALAIDKQEADAYWQRGVSYLKEGAFVSAQTDLQRAVELKPERAEAHAALAECYEGQSLFGQAVSEWRTAITQNSKPAYWRYRYGRLVAERGGHSEAAPHLEYAVVEGSKQAVRPGWLTLALFQEAQTFRRVGRTKDALAAYRDYVASAPASAPDRRDAEQAIAALSGNREAARDPE